MTRTEALIQLAAGSMSTSDDLGQPLTPAGAVNRARGTLRLLEETERLRFDPEPVGEENGWPHPMECIAGSLARLARNTGAGDRHTDPLPEDDDASALRGWRYYIVYGDEQDVTGPLVNLVRRARALPAAARIQIYRDGEGD